MTIRYYKKKIIIIAIGFLCGSFFTGCSSQKPSQQIDERVTSTALDISNKPFLDTTSTCFFYTNEYYSDVMDVQRKRSFNGTLTITDTQNKCMFTSNSIPNHNFNDQSARFATPVLESNQTYEINKQPTMGSSITALSLRYDNAIFLNGVKLDLLAAACYGIGDGKIGCGDEYHGKAWRYDPMSPLNNFGTDQHHAHTQPNGTYHYHTAPEVIYDSEDQIPATVIGFAADGFPIYGPVINDNETKSCSNCR